MYNEIALMRNIKICVEIDITDFLPIFCLCIVPSRLCAASMQFHANKFHFFLSLLRGFLYILQRKKVVYVGEPLKKSFLSLSTLQIFFEGSRAKYSRQRRAQKNSVGLNYAHGWA